LVNKKGSKKVIITFNANEMPNVTKFFIPLVKDYSNMLLGAYKFIQAVVALQVKGYYTYLLL